MKYQYTDADEEDDHSFHDAKLEMKRNSNYLPINRDTNSAKLEDSTLTFKSPAFKTYRPNVKFIAVLMCLLWL
jgi:hypothetical protein